MELQAFEAVYKLEARLKQELSHQIDASVNNKIKTKFSKCLLWNSRASLLARFRRRFWLLSKNAAFPMKNFCLAGLHDSWEQFADNESNVSCRWRAQRDIVAAQVDRKQKKNVPTPAQQFWQSFPIYHKREESFHLRFKNHFKDEKLLPSPECISRLPIHYQAFLSQPTINNISFP